MKHTITATVLIATLLLTSVTATPVQARNSDFGKFLTGVAALFIIGKALEAQSKPKKQTSRNTPKRDNGYLNNNRDHSGWKDQRARRSLPATCKFKVRTRNGSRKVFGERCLNNRFRYARLLPQECKDTVRTRDGRRRVYGAGCLRDYGYKVATRR